MRKALLSILILLLAGYAGICAYLYSQQRAMLYFPQFTRTAASQTDFSLARAGVTLRGWTVNPGRANAILYFGGNAEPVQRNRDAFARWFPHSTVYLLAYRGYGASDGTPAEAALFADALALYDHVHEAHPGRPIAVLGRSLGTGVASYVASRRAVARLALVTPFDSMAEVAQARYPWLPVRLLVKDRYTSDHYLSHYRGPVLVVRAGHDQVVGWARTQVLIDALPRPPQVLELPQAGHDSVQAFPAYAQALRGFLDARGDR
jgi:alpha-beta hydrolase superfamily lysophospholipase